MWLTRLSNQTIFYDRESWNQISRDQTWGWTQPSNRKWKSLEISPNMWYVLDISDHEYEVQVCTNKCGSSIHYDDVIMTMLASQITSLTVVYSIVYTGVNQRKHQSSAWLAFVREIHRGPVNFPHKWPVTRKMFPFDDVIMWSSVSGTTWFLAIWTSTIKYALLFDNLKHESSCCIYCGTLVISAWCVPNMRVSDSN